MFKCCWETVTVGGDEDIDKLSNSLDRAPDGRDRVHVPDLLASTLSLEDLVPIHRTIQCLLLRLQFLRAGFSLVHTPGLHILPT